MDRAGAILCRVDGSFFWSIPAVATPFYRKRKDRTKSRAIRSETTGQVLNWPRKFAIARIVYGHSSMDRRFQRKPFRFLKRRRISARKNKLHRRRTIVDERNRNVSNVSTALPFCLKFFSTFKTKHCSAKANIYEGSAGFTVEGWLGSVQCEREPANLSSAQRA